MLPEWFAIVCVIVAWCGGFLTCGAIIGRTPFWDGVRTGLGRHLWRALTGKEGT
jgi:hypothetical protein